MPELRRPAAPRPPSPSRLVRRQVVLEEHDPLPDGTGAVVVVRAVRGEAYRSHLHLVRFGGMRRADRRDVTQPLTTGAVRDSRPRVSPDGRRVAFLRSFPDDPDRPTAVMVADLAGGESWTLWAPPHGGSEVAWSPDGRRLAVVAGSDPPHLMVGPVRKGRTPTARRITRLDWRRDDVGHRDRRDHLWIVATRDGARPRRLTRGDFDVRDVTWSPDGRALAFAADPRPDADLLPRPSIWAVPATGGEPREMIHLAGFAGSPAFSPDGRWLACSGVDVPAPLDDEQPGPFVAPADGSGPAVALAPGLDRPVGAWLDTDLNGWMAPSRPGPAWDGPAGLVALVTERGRTVPWRFPVDSATGRPAGEPVRLADADAACWALGVAAGTVSVVGTLDDRPMELMTVERAGTPRARLRVRTRLGSAWRRGIPWPTMRSIEVPGEGGLIETWVASPAGAPDTPLPTIVDVHGGPTTGGWAPAPSIEAILLCARGYRVVMPNIRGGAGYGRAWTSALFGDWGGPDAADVLAVVDHAVAAGLADPERLGILGLSYGGFLAQWMIGAVPERFRAAVAEAGVANQVAAWGNADTGVEYNRAELLGDPLSDEGAAKLWRQSPLRLAPRMRAPLLILQGEEDLRCAAADNEQLFVALRVLGREVEYVLYPETYHCLGVTGRPDRRIDRHERMLAWFDRFVCG
ncbi:MAG: alpha/beta fold hydrolase [Chloroflexi bacterium]|nr:alpha/beta fold hydrolase [Chloroflexota bacterium]